MQLRAHGAPTDLHAALSPLFLEEVASELKNFTQVIKRTTDARWVLFQHADGWYLEVQCKTTRDLLANKGERDKFVRGANVAIPGSRSVPDIMVSFLPHHGCSRIPLWFIDLKLDTLPVDAWPQACQHGLDGLLHNMSICPRDEWALRTSIWNYNGDCLQLVSWELAKEPFSITSRCVNVLAHPSQLAKSVVEWCLEQANVLRMHEVKTENPHYVMWFTASELNSREELVSEFGNCEFAPLHSRRHSLYLTTGGWFLKLLQRDGDNWDELVNEHHRKIEFVSASLSSAHVELEGMIPAHKFRRLSDQFGIQAVKQVGGMGVVGLYHRQDGLRKFLFRMLALAQIPLYDDGEYLCHGDLQGANVNAEGQVIDFEFLGRETSKRSDAPEISWEQYSGRNLTPHTAAWQLAVLLVEAAGTDEAGNDQAWKLHNMRQSGNSQPFSPTFPVELGKFWKEVLTGMVHAFGSLEVYKPPFETNKRNKVVEDMTCMTAFGLKTFSPSNRKLKISLPNATQGPEQSRAELSFSPKGKKGNPRVEMSLLNFSVSHSSTSPNAHTHTHKKEGRRNKRVFVFVF